MQKSNNRFHLEFVTFILRTFHDDCDVTVIDPNVQPFFCQQNLPRKLPARHIEPSETRWELCKVAFPFESILIEAQYSECGWQSCQIKSHEEGVLADSESVKVGGKGG